MIEEGINRTEPVINLNLGEMWHVLSGEDITKDINVCAC